MKLFTRGNNICRLFAKGVARAALAFKASWRIYFPLTGDLLAEDGELALTLTGATAGRTFDDYRGNEITLPVDVPGFVGAQYVENLHTSPNDPTAWTQPGSAGTWETGIADRVGGTNAIRLTRTHNTSAHSTAIAAMSSIPDAFITSVWARVESGTGVIMIAGDILDVKSATIPTDGQWYRVCAGVTDGEGFGFPWKVGCGSDAQGGAKDDVIDFCQAMIEVVDGVGEPQPDGTDTNLPRNWIEGSAWFDTEVCSTIDNRGIIIDSDSVVQRACINGTHGSKVISGISTGNLVGFAASGGAPFATPQPKGSIDTPGFKIGGCRVRTIEYIEYTGLEATDDFRIVIDNAYGDTMHPQDLFEYIEIRGIRLYTRAVVNETRHYAGFPYEVFGHGQNSKGDATAWTWGVAQGVPHDFLENLGSDDFIFGLNPRAERDFAMKTQTVVVTTGTIASNEYGAYEDGTGSMDVADFWGNEIVSIGDGDGASTEFSIKMHTMTEGVRVHLLQFYKVEINGETFYAVDADMSTTGAYATWVWTGLKANLALDEVDYDCVFYEKPFSSATVKELGPIGYANTVEDLTLPTADLPVNDFVISFTFTPDAAPPTQGAVCGSYTDANNYIELNLGFLLNSTVNNATAGAAAIHIPTWVAGEPVEIEWHKSSTDNMWWVFDGVPATAGVDPDGLLDIVWDTTLTLGNTGNPSDDDPTGGNISNFEITLK